MTVFTVNGRRAEAKLDVRESLLEVLRDRLGLFGTKKGCDQGRCGACTVHLDDRRVLSCLTLAVRAEGSTSAWAMVRDPRAIPERPLAARSPLRR